MLHGHKSRRNTEHNFARVPDIRVSRSVFDRSAGHKTTLFAGYLVPIYVDEVVPGDSFAMRCDLFGRLSTPKKPFLDNAYLDTHFFFVPNRLLWTNWQRFCGERDDPDDSIDFTVPICVSPGGGYAVNSLQDYVGIPPGQTSIVHSNLVLRAYNLIYNQWFRDQNLQDSVVVDLDDGPDDPADYVLLRRNKRHDYFTSCLPFTQKGVAPPLPLGTSAPVIGNNTDVTIKSDVDATTRNWYFADVGGQNTMLASGTLAGGNEQVRFVNSGLIADLSQATASTINDLREAWQIQVMLELDARGGTRYPEIIMSHFNVDNGDARLQRAEYLGGGSTYLNIHTVAQTSGSTESEFLGDLAGFGTVGARGHGFRKSFTEFGIIIGLVSLRADLTYQQGLHRMFSRSTRYDFYWPQFAHLGEQAVYNKEIFVDVSGGLDDGVFGYQERYAEYRYLPSRISGEFRSDAAQPLDIWHLAQDFASLPLLNADFVEEHPPFGRVVVTGDLSPHLLLDCHFKLRCARPMPVYSVPVSLSRF